MNRIPKVEAKKLNKILNSTLAMKVETHMCHFNVVGKNFKQYHELFQEIYEELEKAIDDIGETIRAHSVAADLNLSKANDFEEMIYSMFSSEDSLTSNWRFKDLLGQELYESLKDKALNNDFRRTDITCTFILLNYNEEIINTLRNLREDYSENNLASLEDFVIERIRAHKQHRYMLMSHLKTDIR